MTRSTQTDAEAYDLIVVGGGTAGIVGAKTAAQLGSRVLLVERARTGGDCLWTGCVPSKAILASAAVAATARSAHEFGIEVSEVGVDFPAVMKHVQASIATSARHDSPAALQADGVEVVHGTAVFTGPGTVMIDGSTSAPFRQALLATGAAPALPPIAGLRQAPFLTSDTVWDLTEVPTSLVVLGGGSIGCELGSTTRRPGRPSTPV